MTDLGPILRRRVGDPLPELTVSAYGGLSEQMMDSFNISERAALPTNMRGGMLPPLLWSPLPLTTAQTCVLSYWTPSAS